MTAATSGEPFTGSEATVVSCACKRDFRATREAIENGLKLIRLRFSLGKGELPLLEVSSLDKFLLYLLGTGTTRASVQFPRVQRGWCNEGFPRFVRLGRKSRWALAHSVASLKRSIPPATCALHPPPSSFDKWLANTTQVHPSSPEYLQFARSVARKVFRFGWDRTYESFCESTAPRASARFEKKTNGSDEWARLSNRSEYYLATTRGVLPAPLCPDPDFRIRYKEVASAGKCRPLGIPSLEFDLLAPLHKAMYQYIASKEWIMRGPPTSKRIERVCKGKYQTSVDLVSATDNLPLDVTEAILGVALAKSSNIPGPVKVWACQSLRPSIFHKGWCVGIVSHGQMMGTYLSFPLLCLQSYVAALWAGRHSKVRGILVNGDDTIISSDHPLGSYPDGFQLNERKTIRSENVAELNSTTFLRKSTKVTDKKKKGWEEVRSLRRGAALADFSGILHLASAAIKAGPRWVDGLVKMRWGSRWKLTPLQLGFSLRVHSAWRRQTCALIHFPLKHPEPSLDNRFMTVFDEPTGESQLAFREQLFNTGRRSVGGTLSFNTRKSLWKSIYGVPHVPQAKRGPAMLPTRGKFRTRTSYDPCWKPEPSLHRDRWFLSLEHEEFWEKRKEKERSRLLRAWATSSS